MCRGALAANAIVSRTCFPRRCRRHWGLRFSGLGSPRLSMGSQLLDALEKHPSRPDCVTSTNTHRGRMQ